MWTRTPQRSSKRIPQRVTLLGIDPKKLIGQAFESLVSESSRQASQSFLSATRVAPRVDNVHVQLERDQRSVLLTGSLYRQDGAPHLVVLLSRLGEASRGDFERRRQYSAAS